MTRYKTFRAELAPTLRLALPLVLAEVGWMSMAIVDTMMVGRLPNSAVAIAAVSLGGILVIVLGAALIKSAAAQTGIGAAGTSGSVMSHSLEDVAAVLVIAVVYLHELSRILNLCQFAAPIPARSAEATNGSAQPPGDGTAKRLTGGLSSAAKRSSAEMSLPGALISLSGKFG